MGTQQEPDAIVAIAPVDRYLGLSGVSRNDLCVSVGSSTQAVVLTTPRDSVNAQPILRVDNGGMALDGRARLTGGVLAKDVNTVALRFRRSAAEVGYVSPSPSASSQALATPAVASAASGGYVDRDLLPGLVASSATPPGTVLALAGTLVAEAVAPSTGASGEVIYGVVTEVLATSRVRVCPLTACGVVYVRVLDDGLWTSRSGRLLVPAASGRAALQADDVLRASSMAKVVFPVGTLPSLGGGAEKLLRCRLLPL